MKRFLVLFCVCACLGCGKNYDELGVKFAEGLGDVMANNTNDCENLAKNVEAYIAQNKDLIAELEAYDQAHPKTDAEKADYSAKYGTRMNAVSLKIAPVLKCASNPKVVDAMKKLSH